MNSQVEMQIIRYPTSDRKESWFQETLASIKDEPINLKIYEGSINNVFNQRKKFIKDCKTPFLCYIDDDDKLNPGIIEKCLNVLNKEENKKICGIFTNYIVIDKNQNSQLYIKKEYNRKEHSKNINRPFHFILIRTEAALNFLKCNISFNNGVLYLITAYCSLYGDWKYLNELGYFWKDRKNSFGKNIKDFNILIEHCSNIILSK